MRKHSRQRDAVLDYLRSVTCHPTAALIYDRVRDEIPNISLGTVYRNLSELKESGEIISFTPGDGIERFDGDTREHLHLICRSCGEVADMPRTDFACVIGELEQLSGCRVEDYDVIFKGLCSSCNNKINGGKLS